jgi:hypothetical protein
LPRNAQLVAGGGADEDASLPAGATLFYKALRALYSTNRTGDTVEVVGNGLYHALTGPVRDLFNLVWGQVRGDQGTLLRVRLHFDAPELGMLPWEYLRVGDRFLCQHPRQSLIRYPEVPDLAPSLRQARPLKVLIWTANPSGTVALDFQQEVKDIEQELRTRLRGNVQIDLVQSGGPRDLLHKLHDGYHILHYIGHGKFDGEGKLAFEPSPGADPTWVSADQLKPGLLDNPSLQLIFLNSCQTAMGAVSNAYASLGFNLARYTPAVIAMQYPVLDTSAIIFAQAFYDAFGTGQPLDVCVTEGRQALLAEYGEQRKDWGIPALFTRAVA